MNQSDEKENYWARETLKYKSSHARLSIISRTVTNLPGTQKTLLDIGAGPGTLGTLLPKNIAYTGLDITGSADHSAGVKYCDFDQVSNQTKIDGNPFDIVVISGVLEYLANWEHFTEIVKENWLMDQGYLFVSFINKQFYNKYPNVLPHPKWKTLFDLPDVMKWTESSKLNIINIYPLFKGTNTLTNPLSNLMRWSASKPSKISKLEKSWISQYLFFLQRN